MKLAGHSFIVIFNDENFNWYTNRLPEPRTMDRGSRTGVTEGVSSSDLDFVEGGGPQGAGGGQWITDFNTTISRPKNADKTIAKE